MAQAKTGDKVRVHYTGRLNDGEIFDSSEDREPLEFTIGQQQVIPGFEEAVVGMNPGDATTVEIKSNQAYGPHRDELVMEVERDQIPPSIQPEVGQYLQIRQGNGQPMIVTVTAVSDNTLTLDANHPLAGQDLIFDIQLIEII
ncbi:MAG TPA: peptidylprolyl isomerase [Chloroflexi bacterium]|jgi:peptidylprolyl isomerase|nr:peptidylprolyl isomerase [Chloroflexota bacterium]